MGKVVFLSIPASGHINPTLGLTRELVNRGEEILYYASSQFSKIIRSTGAQFKGYEKYFQFDQEKMTLDPLTLVNYLMAVTVKTLSHGFVEEIGAQEPDYLIHDQMCLWGALTGQILGLPSICSNPTFAFNNRFKRDYFFFNMFNMPGRPHARAIMEYVRTVRHIRRCYGLRSFLIMDVLSNFEELNIVYTSRYFQPYGDTFDGRFVFMGPSIEAQRVDSRSDFQVEKTRGRPLIYISLGTLFNENLPFYQACFEVFRNEPCDVILSVGTRVSRQNLTHIPSNFMVKDHVPQLEVLKRADLFVTHGGSNSVNEALFFEVPLVVIPQQADTIFVARRVEQLNCGIVIKRNRFSKAALKTAVHRVLGEKNYRENCRKIAASFKRSGGYRKGADEIFSFQKRKRIGRSNRMPAPTEMKSNESFVK